MNRQSVFIVWTCQRLTGLINRPDAPVVQVHCLDTLYIFLGIIEAIWSLSLFHTHDGITIARSVIVLNGPVLEPELEGVRSFGFLEAVQ